CQQHSKWPQLTF
nr:immunoglobulin light chain junction region [Macaca mulatta]MPN90821.1 immunoglobulin light chain junction region [Macaca mulatta]MPN90825.1 immunoglobulin light chain junction region [Macaca mulatta]MPN90838.1 immunoglobulin light chain junction region [Macaca mulatta]MPN90859.1 immunoglobulin light chain junction region [Macaca mulatta]